MNEPDINLINRRREHMDKIDNLPPELRQCVHEYGFSIVWHLMCYGVKDPSHIHQIVKEVWDGARGFGKGHGNRKKGPKATVDWLLIQSGSSLTADTLARALWEQGYAIVPRDPTPGMIEASKAEVSGFNQIVTKSEKHQKRLRVAVEQYVKSHWPGVFRGKGFMGGRAN